MNRPYPASPPFPTPYHRWPDARPYYPPQFGMPSPPKSLAIYRWCVGALVAFVGSALLITGFVLPGFWVTKKLDVANVQAGVQRVLSDPSGYGAKDVGDVACNDGQNPTIAKGSTFTCEATIDRVKQLFVVTFTDDAGNYTVGRPHQTGGRTKQFTSR